MLIALVTGNTNGMKVVPRSIMQISFGTCLCENFLRLCVCSCHCSVDEWGVLSTW